MRFIGNKQNLLNFIYIPIEEHKINSGVFIDIFSGTASVGKFFKKLGYPLISNDLLSFSYALQRAYIQNNIKPAFKKLETEIQNPSLSSVIKYLNNLEGVEDFIYNNFTVEGTKEKRYKRNYFSEENAKKIDAIRSKIEEWKEKNLITEDEYYILLASLIEAIPYVSNIAGTYGAFLKKDDPRKYKKILLKNSDIVINNYQNFAFNEDGNKLIEKIKGDILYIDPPYNTRQYAANYHILEHVAIWDKEIRDSTKTGLRDYRNQKSLYCIKDKVYDTTLDLIDKAINKACVKHVLFSYNSEGLLKDYQIKNILSRYGKVHFYKKSYPRYNSHRENSKQIIDEYLFYLSIH